MFESVAHIGYKKCQDGRIVKLEIIGQHNENRKDIVDKNFARIRCSEARVLDIYDMYDSRIKYSEAFGLHDRTFSYRRGEIVKSDHFDLDLEQVCSNGIHYYLSEEPAIFWNIPKDRDGMHKKFYQNGQIARVYNRKNGKFDGIYEEFDHDGKIRKRCTYKDSIKVIDY